MRQSLIEKLDLKVDGAALTPTNIRSNLYYLANHEFFQTYRNTSFGRDPEVERGFQYYDVKGWDSKELIKILQTVLLDAEAYLWWLEQLAIVTNGHYTAPMEISEHVAKQVLENRLDSLTSDQLHHLATSPGQLMQMFWEINESQTDAWKELKDQIGEELLGLIEEPVTLSCGANSNLEGAFDSSTATAANADDGDQAVNVDDEKSTSTASNAPPVFFLDDISAVDSSPTMLDADDDLPRAPEELENDGEVEDEEPSK